MSETYLIKLNKNIDYTIFEKLVIMGDAKVGKSLLIKNLFPSIKLNYESNCKNIKIKFIIFFFSIQ